jgi:hypothetical protein
VLSWFTYTVTNLDFVRHGSREKVFSDLKKKNEAYNTAVAQINNCTKFVNSMSEAMEGRQKTWKDFRRVIAVRAKHAFSGKCVH